MYEAPIKLMQRQLEIKEENGILQAVKDVGVVVDKEELIKALKYDRGQYDKGYHDGYAVGYNESYINGVRAFAEKLKSISLVEVQSCIHDGYDVIDAGYDDIDNLVEEMIGGAEEE